MKKIFNLFIICTTTLLTYTACSTDDLEPTLAQEEAVETSVNSADDLNSLLIGMYSYMADDSFYGRDVLVYGDARTDNAYSNGSSGRFITISRMDLISTDGYAEETWQRAYEAIANANIIIGADTESLEGDLTTINHYKAQAYAARALVHFELLKLYGQEHAGGTLGIPYITKYKDDIYPARNTVAEVKAAIADDFTTALSLISSSLDTSKEFITKEAIYGFQSRFYIYTKNWTAAKTAAYNVINSAKFSIATTANYVSTWSTDGSANSIFELAYSDVDKLGNTGLGEIYNGTAYGDIEALEGYYNLFEAGDIRISSSMFTVTGNVYRNAGKFPSTQGDTNLSLLRYEEVILNYAEALFNLNDSNAITYLNMIPANRNATAYTSISEAIILKERQKELAFEGFRFWDLLRTGQGIDYVDSKQTFSSSGVAYGSNDLAFPIPEDEVNANTNMVQNDGY